MKKLLLIGIPALLISIAIGIGIYVVYFMPINTNYEEDAKFKSQIKGDPDKLGSWGQINQTIARADNWQQIVKNSQFQLGEKKFREIWPDGNDVYDIAYGTYPVIDGSTTCVPMAVEFARQHLGLSDGNANNIVAFQTTHTAYVSLIKRNMRDIYRELYMPDGRNDLIDKPVDILLATEPSKNELFLAKWKNVELIYKPVCYDAFVFITHKDNPVDSLTVEQVQKIYSGKITNWKEVGGKDEKIIAYQREEDSGSQTAMEQQVMKGKKMAKPSEINIIKEMGDLIKTIVEYQNKTASIGYSFKYYIDTLYKNDNIKIIKINGIEPNNTTMQNHTYPFTTNYFGVIRAEDKDNTGGKFLDWMLSDEGQKCIIQAGYCPLK